MIELAKIERTGGRILDIAYPGRFWLMLTWLVTWRYRRVGIQFRWRGKVVFSRCWRSGKQPFRPPLVIVVEEPE